jgi:nicotinamidase-related amidase
MVTALDPATSLVLIDLQKGITQRATVHPMTQILANAAKLVEAFRKARLPIVIVTVNPAAGGPKPPIRRDAQLPSSTTPTADWLEVVPEIKTAPEDIFITKHTWGAFYDTPLHEELQKRKVTGIVLGGVATSIGVEGTARGAAERNYNIAFAADAMTDLSASAHEHSINIIFPRIGEVDVTERIIEQVGKVAR